MIISWRHAPGTAVLLALLAATSLAFAREQREPGAEQAISPDQEIGARFHITADTLAKPMATPAVSNAPLILPFNGQARRCRKDSK
jgi:hypothetical protein